MTPSDTLIECEKAVLFLVANVTDIVNGGTGDAGSYYDLEQPTAGYVIAVAMGLFGALAQQGLGDLIQDMARRVALATHRAVTGIDS